MNRIILSVMLTRSNFGQPLDHLTVERLIQHPPKELSSAVMQACGLFMEDERDEDMWLEEAEGWYEQLAKMTDQQIIESWPSVCAVYLLAQGTATA